MQGRRRNRQSCLEILLCLPEAVHGQSYDVVQLQNQDGEIQHSNIMPSSRNVRQWIYLLFLLLYCFIMSIILIPDRMFSILDSASYNLKDAMPQNFFRKLLQDETDAKNYSGDWQQRYPNCIIIGVRKCGTRALLEFLSLHPSIENAKLEIHFFDKEDRYSKGLEWYKKQMPFTFSSQITIEKTPAYFITKEAPERIYFMNPAIKLLVILRDPTTRVISDYTQVCSNRRAENKSCFQFEDLAINSMIGQVDTDYKAVDTSIYCKHLFRWLHFFPLDQIYFVDGDKLLKDPLPELQKVEKFLNVTHTLTKDNFYFNKTRGFYCSRNSTGERCLAPSKGRRHPVVELKVVKKLQKFFQQYNIRLFKLIGRKFNWP